MASQNSSKNQQHNRESTGGTSKQSNNNNNRQETEQRVDEYGIKESLWISKKLQSHLPEILDMPLLTPLDCSFGLVRTRSNSEKTVRKVVLDGSTTNAPACATICLLIRRPGTWGTSVRLFGIIKEYDSDISGVLSFYENYFKYPLYQDSKWKLYNAMDNPRLSTLKFLKNYFRIRKRLNSKNINENMVGKGDGRNQGGLFILDAAGNLCYAIEEDFSVMYDMEQLELAVETVRSKSSSSI